MGCRRVIAALPPGIAECLIVVPQCPNRRTEAAGRGTTQEMPLIDSVRMLEKAIFEVIHESLLSLDLSFLMMDLGTLNDILALQLKASITAFVESEQKVM